MIWALMAVFIAATFLRARHANGCLTALIITIAIFASCWWVMGGYTTVVRSRLTLVVETPEGERTGSSVRQLTIYSPGRVNRAIGFSSLNTVGEEGQAVVVDLGARGLLFATLASERELKSSGMDMYTPAAASFPQEHVHGDVGEGIWAKDDYTVYLEELNRLKPKGELTFDDLPVLVRFKDKNDPSSVEQVNPSDLAASFGSGVKLLRASVEIVDDSPTTGIERLLPWLGRTDTSPRLIPSTPGIHLMSDMSTVQLLSNRNFRRKFP